MARRAGAIVQAVPTPCSIPAFAPSLDRDVLRAMLGVGGPWARSPEELGEVLSEHCGLANLHWVHRPEQALCSAILQSLGLGDAQVAAPSWGHPGYRGVLEQTFARVLWLEPQTGHLDPGMEAVARALEDGARAILLAPVAGDCSALSQVASLCRRAGALLALDLRASSGSRLPEGRPETHGDLVLLPVDGEPHPSPCPGAFLATTDPPINGIVKTSSGAFSELGSAAQLVIRSICDDPRLRRLWSGPRLQDRSLVLGRTGAPPAWVFSAAHARLLQANSRATQRARHARTLRHHCGNLPAVELIPELPGCPSAGAAFPLLAQSAAEVREELGSQGIPTVPKLAAWLAPDLERGRLAQLVGSKALLLPLHPFYRPQDLALLGETLRRSTLRVNGTGSSDPTESDEDGEGKREGKDPSPLAIVS